MAETCTLGELAAQVQSHAYVYDEIAGELDRTAGDYGTLHDAFISAKEAQDAWSDDNGRALLDRGIGQAEEGIGELSGTRSKAEMERGAIGETLEGTNSYVAQGALTYGAAIGEQIGRIISPAQSALDGMRQVTEADELSVPIGQLYDAMCCLNDDEGSLNTALATANNLREYAQGIIGESYGYRTGNPAPPPRPAPTPGPVEATVDITNKPVDPKELSGRIKTKIIELLGTITLIDVVHPHKDGAPVDTQDYDLVPLTDKRGGMPSMAPVVNGVEVPDGVVTNYGKPGGTPGIDANQAIALTSKNGDGQQEVRGIVAAGVDHDEDPDALFINQIQGVGNTNDADSQADLNGALSKFNWRKTLVEAWIRVAAELGLKTVVIQSAANNKWAQVHGMADNPQYSGRYTSQTTKGLPPMYNNYDKVADRMGFTQDPASGNWYKKL